MAGKDLQRLATSVDYIDHGQNPRRSLPARRHHISQKVKVAGQRTLYLSVHNDEHPAEIFLRLKGSDYSSELRGLQKIYFEGQNLAYVGRCVRHPQDRCGRVDPRQCVGAGLGDWLWG